MHEVGGYDDWSLPTKDEQHLMYDNLKNAEPTSGGYWIFSEDYSFDTLYHDFYHGNQSIHIPELRLQGQVYPGFLMSYSTMYLFNH